MRATFFKPYTNTQIPTAHCTPFSTMVPGISRASVNRLLLIVLFSVFSLGLFAQFTVAIQLSETPPNHQADSIYLAGSFNGWAPAVEAYKLSSTNSIVLKLNKGNYEFKFTRGSWDKVECTDKGIDVGNRAIQVNGDTSILYAIAGWKDDFTFEKKLTLPPSVHLFSNSFEMPLLHKKKHIWVYLPPGYKGSHARYPVMYMHDGQNIFDNHLAPYGEWGVDECIDSLVAQGKQGCIVVGIENGGFDRMSEYNPFEFTWKREKDSISFAPKADEYLTDIVKTLKPAIDKAYRTLPSKENTIIAGSSMGGLISFYALLKYPNIFGKAGVFSPAFWTANGIDSLTDANKDKIKGKYFFFMGGKEGGTYVEDMNRISGKAGKSAAALVYAVIDPEGEHNEKTWRKWFAEFYNWVLAEGYNVNTSTESK